jgi:two-component system chemotaxis sensor kinase CheA
MALRGSLTIGQRLIALIVLSTIAIVGSLAFFFSSRQLTEIEANLRSKAAAYSQQASMQAQSAVAFSDRETAREVLTSMTKDPDVESVTLFGEDGTALFAFGTATRSVGPSSAAATSVIGGRFVAVTPVVSLEGPRGNLVIELSQKRLGVAKRDLAVTAVITGVVALVVAVLLAWLIVRGVARRLRAIANVATAVAGGDLGQQPVSDARGDEIGLLAAAFNAMLEQIKGLIDHVRDLAKKEQERLEGLVAERTAALDARNAEMRLVFDQIDQGLMVVDFDGTVARERSAAVAVWLGPVPASHSIVDYVRQFAPQRDDWFAMWSMLIDDIMPREVSIAQLPTRFTVEHRELDFAYKMFEAANGVTRILIVITDVTAEVERRRAERDEREIVSLLTRMLKDRGGAASSREEVKRLVAEIVTPSEDVAVYLRAVHTLKGMAGMLELTSIAELCHTLETAHAENETDVEVACRTAIAARWDFLGAKLAPMLRGTDGQLDVHERDLVRLEATIAREASHSELARTVATWRSDRVSDQLERLAEQARALATRLCRSDLEVAVEADPGVRVPASWAPVFSSAVHALRNAIDHGIESAAERVAAGKAPAGKLTLRVRREAGAFVFEIVDDGRGIDWQRVAVKAAQLGLPVATQDDLTRALFQDGLSTRDEVSDTSGRGVGMGALRSACEQTKGRVEVVSTPGQGTTYRCTWAFSSRPPSHTLDVIQLS